MIVLRIVLENLRLLSVIEGSYELVDTKVFSPFFAVYEPSIFFQITAIDLSIKHLHLLCMVDVELSCAQEPELFKCQRCTGPRHHKANHA